MDSREISDKQEGRQEGEVERLTPPLPESTLILLRNIAKGDKKCEKVWEHISGCELCQFAVTFLVTVAAGQDDEEGADAVELVLKKLQEYKKRVSPEWSLDDFFREIEALPQDSKE